MKFFVLLSATLAAASAQYPLGYAGLGYAPAAYGYQNINNAAEQRGTANGNGVTGSYSYVDEAGHHSVSYVADDFGYRVIGRTRRSAQVAPVAYAAGHHVVGAVAPAAYAAVAPAPAAPAREAVLTTIKLNPGHAVFYRVD